MAGAFSPDGRWIFTAGKGGSVKVWNAVDGSLHHTFSHGGPLLKAAFSPDGIRIATAGAKAVKLWDSLSGKQLGPDLTHDELVTDVSFSPAGDLLATACAGTRQPPKPDDEDTGNAPPVPGYARLWDARTGAASGSKLRAGQAASLVVWHPTKPVLALGFEDTIQLWDAKANQPRFPLWEVGRTFGPVISTIAFDERGDRLMVACGSYADASVKEAGVDAIGYVRLWDTHTGMALVAEQQADSLASRPLSCEAWVRDAAIIESGHRQTSILTADDNGEVRLWLDDLDDNDPDRYQVLDRLKAAHEMPVERIVQWGYGRFMSVANHRGAGFGYARTWETAAEVYKGTRATSQRMEHKGLVTGASRSADGALLMTLGDDGMAHVWWAASTEASSEMLHDPDGSSGSPAASDSNDGSLSFGEPGDEAEKPDSSIKFPADVPLDCAALPQDLLDQLINFPAARDQVRTMIPITSDGIFQYHAVRSTDRRWLIVGMYRDERGSEEAVLWNLLSKKTVGRISTELPFKDITFTPDSSGFAVASGFNVGGRIRTYSTRDLAPMGPPLDGARKPLQLAFSPDGRRLAVSFSTDAMDNGGRIGVFEVASGRPLIEARCSAVAPAAMMAFEADGQRLRIGEYIAYDTPAPTGSMPGWLPELARVVGHRELDAAGAVQRIRDVSPRLAALRARVEASPDSPVRKIARFILARPDERMLSPFARKKLLAETGDNIRRWEKTVIGIGKESDASLDRIDLLRASSELRGRLFGQAELNRLIDEVNAGLREKIFADYSQQIAEWEQETDAETVQQHAFHLQEFRHLSECDPGLVLKIRALEARLPSLSAVTEKASAGLKEEEE
ncbi:WD40 repeat domain-containing protein [Luteolibacter ambystomatis]